MAVSSGGSLEVSQGLIGIEFRLLLVCLPFADLLGEVPWVGSEGFLLATYIMVLIKLSFSSKTLVI